MERILITGGAGFLGSHLIDALYDTYCGLSIRVVDNLSLYGKIPDYWSGRAELLIGDVRNKSVMEIALKDIDYVYHLAAYQGYSEDFDKFIDINVKSTALIYAIIEKKHLPIKKVILASSQAVYGNCHNAVEVDSTHPCGAYGVSKFLMEQTADLFAVNTIIFRFGIMQGARQSHGILVNFLNQDIFQIFGDGFQERDYIHVQDAVKACLMIKELPCGVYNVSGRRAYTVKDYISMLYDFGIRKSIINTEPRQHEARDATSNCEKLRSCGWEANVSIEQAIADYIAYRRSYPNLKAIS